MGALVLPPLPLPGEATRGAEHVAEPATPPVALVPVEALRTRRTYRRATLSEPLTNKERRQLAADLTDLAEDFAARPRHGNGLSGDCPTGPCPWMACRHHLKLEVDPDTGAIRDNHPGKDFDEMEETCSFRVAETVPDEGPPLPQPEVGRHLGITWARESQIEGEAVATMQARARRASGNFSGRGRGDTMKGTG